MQVTDLEKRVGALEKNILDILDLHKRDITALSKAVQKLADHHQNLKEMVQTQGLRMH